MLSGSPLSSKPSPTPSATLFLALTLTSGKRNLVSVFPSLLPSALPQLLAFAKVTGGCHFAKPRDTCQAVLSGFLCCCGPLPTPPPSLFFQLIFSHGSDALIPSWRSMEEQGQARVLQWFPGLHTPPTSTLE